MLPFLFFTIEFEQLFLIISGILIFVVVFNILYWLVRLFLKLRKKKKNGNDKKTTTQPTFMRSVKPFGNSTSTTVSTKKSKFAALKNWRTYTSLNFIVIFLSLVLLGVVGYGYYTMFFGYPEIIERYPENDVMWDDQKKPLVIKFDKPFDTSKIKPIFIPDVAGEFKYEKSFDFLPFARKLVFYPKTNIAPDTNIGFYIRDIYSILGSQPRYEHEATFKSGTQPNVQSVSITEGQRDIPINTPIEFTFDKPITDFFDFEYEIIPKVEFKVIKESTKHKLEFTTTLSQSATYKVQAFKIHKEINLQTAEVLTKSDRELVKEVNFRTVDSPNVKAYLPTGSAVLVDSQMKIEFSQDMNPESVQANLVIDPKLDYDPQWPDKKTLIIKQKGALQYGANYTVTVKAGAKGAINTVFENDFAYKFTTIGAVRISSATPGNGSGGISLTSQIRITFDQEVDQASAQSKFAMSPDMPGTFSWERNTMVFKPTASYQYNTRYTYTLGNGIKSKYGQPSVQTINNGFTTLSQTVSLNVPLYSQPLRFDCNLTAARMVLAYRGVNYSVDQIYSQIAKDSTPYDAASNTWGDPNKGYVGDRNGNPKGYGVYWGPVSNLISKYRSNKIYRGMTVSQLATEINAGNPAILWWQNGASSPTRLTWNIPGGGTVSGVNGMHSEVAIGFVGSVDNPTAFIVNDPRGNRRTIPVATFKALWGYFGNTAVVVY